MNVVKIVILAAAGLSAYLVQRRIRIASAAPIADDECVSCGSSDLDFVGPGAYVCRDCGYEGGSGQAKMTDQKRDAEVADLAPQQRMARLEAHLVAAKRVLSACAAERPLSRSVDDVERWQTSVSSQVGEGASELRRAAVLAGRGKTQLSNGFEINPGAMERSLVKAIEADDTRGAQAMARKAAAYLDDALSGAGP